MIFKRDKSAYWYYDFTLAGDRYRGSTKEKTKNAAQAYEAALRTRISERGPSARPKKAPQFREFVPAFRGFIKHHTGLSPKSKAYYEDGIGLLLNSSVASMRLDHIKKSHIQTLQLPGSASWQNCALRTLRRMLAIAKEWGLLWEVPTVPLLEQRQRRDVFDQEVEIQIAAKARQPLQDVFVTMMDTGCRPGEVLALRWEDILWDLGVIFVRRGKTKKSIRYVPMSDRVRDRLAVREGEARHPLLPLERISQGPRPPRSVEGSRAVHRASQLRDWAARHDRKHQARRGHPGPRGHQNHRHLSTSVERWVVFPHQ
jgi:integrase